MSFYQMQKLLEDAKKFFVELNEFLENRSLGMIKDEEVKSRFVSLWEGKIGQENTQQVLASLSKFEASLPRWRSIPELDKAQALVFEHEWKRIVAKTANHLLRAQEFLEELKFNSNKRLAFLGFNLSEEVAKDKLDAEIKHCSDVLKANETVIAKAVRKPNKSWLSQELHYGSLMVASRASLIGMSTYPDAPAMQKYAAENLQQALTFFAEISQKIAEVPTKNARPTKTTRQILGIEKASDTPDAGSMHWQYCPREVGKNMQLLKIVVDRQKEALTKVLVEGALDMEFPEPKHPYVPWKSKV